LGQSDEDAYRLRVLGAKNATCLGNLKYAGLPLPVDEAKKAEIAAQIEGRTVWLVSSTHEDEESKIARFLKDLQEKIPNLLTVIVPRHPNRGVEIAKDLRENLKLEVALRSQNEPILPQTQVYIADTIGELGLWYELIDLVFVGGSLIPHGGQNFMEPSRCRDAVIVGPHMHNFTDAMNRAKKADAVIQVNDVLDLMAMVENLLTNPDLLEAKRSLAYNWAIGEAKVLDGIVEKIQAYIG
jgi:3-deoxy-D-manno-octulosonic-acid transferase